MRNPTEEVTLREYVEQRFDLSDKALSAALAATKEAILKAETATDKRFDSVNEFRQTLTDRDRLNMPRTETELLVKGLSDRLKVIEDGRTRNSGEWSGAKNLWAIIIAAAGIVFGLISYFAKH